MISNVEDLIAKHEGRRSVSYLDSRGIPTIGIGHNLNANPLPSGWSQPLSDAQIGDLFQSDLAVAQLDLFAACPWAKAPNLDPVRQAVLIDMMFNMGPRGLLGFHDTLSAVQRGDWQAAHDGMLASLWAKQVGARAEEDAGMMLTGRWPEE